ncbi:MAG: PilZ domain-containing protein [Candidatus Devosia phytovorans]|uniref:PilZ domain-containing protein n=1 Tax=Candidatus Devosia phytovorans TaxID=3121372 RepID=A0AAJ5VQV9_9HYPH|nr:PilZ domain-containing protein [Devosia sp.]WEK03086.1 MAG: PilZ domain-containing protein [Devosia sp.]
MTEERRATIRHRTLKGARIASNEGFSTFTCMVRNMSDTGALLRLPSIVGVPDDFELVMDDGRTFTCSAVHKSATDIGVRFT